MKHAVIFKNSSNNWDNALPLGNGVFGCMVYYNHDNLYLPMNHYEVYYNISPKVLPSVIDQNIPYTDAPGKPHAERLERARMNLPKEGEPFTSYNCQKEAAFNNRPYDIVGFSGSYPATGDLIFGFDDALRKAESNLTLFTEDAAVSLKLNQGKASLALDTRVARRDCVLCHVKQSASSLVRTLRLSMEPYRDFDQPSLSFRGINSRTFAYTVTRSLSADENVPFTFSGIIRLIGAEGSMTADDTGMTITFENAEREFTILTAVFSQWKYKAPLTDGLSVIEEYEKSLSTLYDEHKAYWDAFFRRSSIDLPDKFLEQAYTVNQYALDCCCGRDGIMKHHACGLNGLWDVKHPSLWGSMWYWDVNIQAAFAGVFSGNRLELAKVFSDGLRSYTALAEKSARNVHNLSGYASDYPYSFYYCCWLWCAQYLWFLYEYSLDEDYLKNEAYPLFLKLAEFVTGIFTYDEKTGYYTVYPDISPEQGPLAHNTTITVASAKYLLKFTLEAAEILEDSSPLLERCRQLLDKMPPYAFSEEGSYGVHLKDSPDAPDNMWIRHPSMLMPLFPIGEFDLDSDEKIKKILSNTIDFLENNCEIGIFGGSWIAASAARLGRGQTALRLLYERGLDHMLRSNGLTAEETERFLNYCLIPRQPLYYPCMMEFTGEMLVALNEMLLQSHNRVIRVFPALPDGDRELYRMLQQGYSFHEYYDRYVDYEAWNTVRFDKLLAKGAFEISAARCNGELRYIAVYSRKGGRARITSPFLDDSFSVWKNGQAVAFENEEGVICFDTEADGLYFISREVMTEIPAREDNSYNTDILTHEAVTKRKIFIGEDQNTAYYKALDGFIRSWYLGNVRMENRTVYKFDFGGVADKDYAAIFPRQCYTFDQRVIKLLAFNFIGQDALPFTVKRGFGFTDCTDIKSVDRGAPDGLRRDFAEGIRDTEFVIEAPRGQYELLVVSGDQEEESLTDLEAINGRAVRGEKLSAGQYQAKLLPLVNEEEQPIRLRISTREGYKWKINFIMLNAVKGY